MKRVHYCAVWMASVALLAFGCGQPPASEPAADATPAAEHAGHSHTAGPHGGTIADWGGGKYHVEFTVDHDAQQATVYILGDDASTLAPITAETLLLNIEDPQVQVPLTPMPDGGQKGSASRFVGKHESLGTVREFAGSISGEIDGTPYVGDFSEHGHSH